MFCGASSPQGAWGQAPGAASWAPLGHLLGGFWRILGVSLVAPGSSWAPSWGILRRLEGIFKASARKFNVKMEPSWH